MAEFVVKIADDRGRVQQHVEHGYSEAEVRDRFSSARISGLLGQAAGSAGRRRFAAPAAKAEAGYVPGLQPAVPDADPGRAADSEFARTADQAAERPQLKQILENVRDRVKGGELLSDAFAAQGIIPKIYTTTLMAGEKSGNIDEVLTRYISFQRLAMTFRKKLFVSLIYPTLLVTVVHDHGDVSVHLRRAEVCGPVQQPGRKAAGDHRVHAGGGNERAEVCTVCVRWAGGGRVCALAVEGYRSRRGPD